jgi:hypothetical protein
LLCRASSPAFPALLGELMWFYFAGKANHWGPFQLSFFPLKISAFMSCFVLFYDVVPLWMF